MVAEIWASVISPFVDQWVALTTGLSGADVRLSCHKVIFLLLNGLQMVFKD